MFIKKIARRTNFAWNEVENYRWHYSTLVLQGGFLHLISLKIKNFKFLYNSSKVREGLKYKKANYQLFVDKVDKQWGGGSPRGWLKISLMWIILRFKKWISPLGRGQNKWIFLLNLGTVSSFFCSFNTYLVVFSLYLAITMRKKQGDFYFVNRVL